MTQTQPEQGEGGGGGAMTGPAHHATAGGRAWDDGSRAGDVTVETVIGEVARVHGLHPEDLTRPHGNGGSRRRHVVEARQQAMWLAYRGLGITQPKLGRAFGRDSSTVHHAVMRVDELIRSDDVTRFGLSRAERALWPGRKEGVLAGDDAVLAGANGHATDAAAPARRPADNGATRRKEKAPQSESPQGALSHQGDGLQAAASVMRKLFLALTGAGFTDEQALSLVGRIMTPQRKS